MQQQKFTCYLSEGRILSTRNGDGVAQKKVTDQNPLEQYTKGSKGQKQGICLRTESEGKMCHRQTALHSPLVAEGKSYFLT